MVDKALYSNNSDEWETPHDLFDKLNKEFSFTMDGAATEGNSKCKKFCYENQNIDLLYDPAWKCERVWLNPPYSKLKYFCEVALRQSVGYGAIVVMLLPSRTDTKYWHDIIMPYAHEIRFFKGRLNFEGGKHSAPFPSCLVIFRPIKRKRLVVKSIEK